MKCLLENPDKSHSFCDGIKSFTTTDAKDQIQIKETSDKVGKGIRHTSMALQDLIEICFYKLFLMVAGKQCVANYL